MNTNPCRGPYHFRAPSKIFWRTVRGMLPHKQYRGKDAMERLKVYEGVPPPYDKIKRIIVPSALRVIRLKPRRKYCKLDRLASEVGWKASKVVGTLEKRRKLKAAIYYKKKKTENKLMEKARQNVLEKNPQYQQIIEGFGYH
jgi:large subunit ribosomal protein L13Ae